MAELPSGTVTFLLTDVEGSTALWEEAPEAMRAALARHDALFDQIVREHHGTHIRPRGEGDSRFAVFTSATGAVAAAIAVQRAFGAEAWPTPRPVQVRIGIHTGEAEVRDGDYYGSAVNRCARLRGIGHGGQILLSAATTALVRDGTPCGVRLLDLGRHRLKGLTEPERVSQVVAPELAADFPPLDSLDARPHNLPTHPTALLGRERELADVRELFEDGARLVTLTGPGGTGKTRLGLQVAADLLDGFEHGAFLVDLAPISDPALVPSTIAQGLDIRDLGDRPVVDALKEGLRARSVFLLLDNFEQVLPAASVVGDLLAACPDLAVLATSRESLRLRGEHEYAVPPLALPTAGRETTAEVASSSPAVALFVQRARAIRADFALSDENAPAVAEICARIDGLPLAIELAAARVRLLSPEAMLGRLERRLPLLTGGARDLPERQRTLRDAIAWSHALLTSAEQRLFRRLAVFVGGFTLEAAETICTHNGESGLDVLDGVASLVAQSLIRRQGDARDEPRFAMLETIREFGLERLDASGEADPVRSRHASYFVGLAELAAPELYGREQLAWMTRLDAEHDNLRAAFRWAGDRGDVELGLRLGAAVWRFWQVRGHFTEGRERLAALLTSAREPVSAAPRAALLAALGVLLTEQGDYAAARSYFDEGLTIWRRLGDERGIAQALTGLAWIAIAEGDFSGARALHERNLAIRRRFGDERGIADALNGLGWVAIMECRYEEAHDLLAESLEIGRQLGHLRGITNSLVHLACLANARGDPGAARGPVDEALVIAVELGDRSMAAEALELSAKAALADQQGRRAARLLGTAHILRKTIGAPTTPSDRAAHEEDVAAVRALLGDQAFAAAWAEGVTMTLEQAIAYALDERPSA